jgi:phage terminase large subunit-like protein
MVGKWNRSIGELDVLNGSKIRLFSSEEPDRLRGPQHHDVWCDELAAWKQRDQDAWDMMQFGLRLGPNPRCFVTTTPRPKRLVKALLADPTSQVVTGTTMENAANLSERQVARLLAKYDGTRLGRQELFGELLDDTPGALWSMRLLDEYRVPTPPDTLVRTVIAVDPAITSGDDADETGIIAAGRDRVGHGYVLGDRSGRFTPDGWARAVWDAYDEFHADVVVVEVNQGGEMVTSTLRSVRPGGPIRTVHAAKGKRVRAEPISAMYEQGRVHHVGADLGALEDQLTTWTQDDKVSPDRLDALVWAMTDLMAHGGLDAYVRALANTCVCGFPNLAAAVSCARCGSTLTREA